MFEKSIIQRGPKLCVLPSSDHYESSNTDLFSLTGCFIIRLIDFILGAIFPQLYADKAFLAKGNCSSIVCTRLNLDTGEMVKVVDHHQDFYFSKYSITLDKLRIGLLY